MKAWLSKSKYLIILVVIIGFIFRSYNFQKAFMFAHDQDLYSWIAKDIVVNRHQRLVGQITSVDGVFIGSFYYYLMALAYFLGRMNPLSAAVPVTLIGLAGIVSFYWVVKKHFGYKSALIASFIYAVSYGIASFDRWSVPTEPTLLWSIWFLEVILELSKGNLRWLPLYGFLSGFIWQLHIALLPILPIPILAYLISRSKINLLWSKKYLMTVIMAISVFIITLSPFLIFEFKHEFSQVKSMVAATKKAPVGPTGMGKLLKVVDASGREFQQRVMLGNSNGWPILYWLIFIFCFSYLYIKKRISGQWSILIIIWLFLIMWAQYSSTRIVSEYYFSNLTPIYVLIMALFLSEIKLKRLTLFFLAAYLVINLHWLFIKSDVSESYYYRLLTVEFIKKDIEKNSYPCVAINFIADPGVGVGFRYLFWYRGIKIIKAGTPGVPVYNIPIPWQINLKDNPSHFGRFGVIIPPIPREKFGNDICDNPIYQLDPLLGYTE